jgi:hypothetical protein
MARFKVGRSSFGDKEGSRTIVNASGCWVEAP